MYFRKSFFNFIKKYNVLYVNLKQQQQNLHLYYVDKNYISPLILTNVSQYSSDSLSKCWNCNFVYKSDLFCSKCKVLQKPPENLTYFDIIGVPQSYDVKVTEIQKKYKELQKLLHPDKFGTKSEVSAVLIIIDILICLSQNIHFFLQKEKQFSETLSSLVNNAYSTLIHPLKRGLYMLKLNDITISEETDNANAEFLMEIMEKNEEIEDVGDDVEKIKKLVQENEIMLNNLTK